MTAFLLDVGRFHTEELNVSQTLGTILKDGIGVTVHTRSIETLPIPTWLPSCKLSTKEESLEFNILNDSSFATKVKYLETAPKFTASKLYTDENIESDLYLVEDTPFHPDRNLLVY